MKYFNVTFDEVPLKFDLIANEELFTLTIKYNPYGDYFTMDIQYQERLLAEGLKIVYGQDICRSIRYMDNIPQIVPIDEHREFKRVNYNSIDKIDFYVIESDENV